MDDWEESENWHEDLMVWERFQDELERINGSPYKFLKSPFIFQFDP